jgi:hypothetical protein
MASRVAVGMASRDAGVSGDATAAAALVASAVNVAWWQMMQD